MRCVIQRVTRASVEVEGAVVGAIGRGLLVLAAVQKGDTHNDVQRTAHKIVGLRIFADAAGKMNLNLGEAGGAILVVSQFTLAGSVERGRRPSFDGAEEPERARELFEQFVSLLRELGTNVESGVFREHMAVELVNDGPVTFVLDSREPKAKS